MLLFSFAIDIGKSAQTLFSFLPFGSFSLIFWAGYGVILLGFDGIVEFVFQFCAELFFSLKFFFSFFRLGGWPELIGNSAALNFSFSLELLPNKGQFKVSTVLNLVAWATCFIFEFFLVLFWFCLSW